MKQYIKPEIKISMFSAETVSTEENVDARLSALYGPEIDALVPDGASNSVKRNYSFDDAIKFK